MTQRWTPLGATITDIIWHSVPDKYNPPRDFDRLSKARRYDTSGYLTAEIRLFDAPGESWSVHAFGWDDTIPDRAPVGATVVERRYRLRGNESTFDTPDAAIAAGARGFLVEELRFVTRDGNSFWIECGPVEVGH